MRDISFFRTKMCLYSTRSIYKQDLRDAKTCRAPRHHVEARTTVGGCLRRRHGSDTLLYPHWRSAQTLGGRLCRRRSSDTPLRPRWSIPWIGHVVLVYYIQIRFTRCESVPNSWPPRRSSNVRGRPSPSSSWLRRHSLTPTINNNQIINIVYTIYPSPP